MSDDPAEVASALRDLSTDDEVVLTLADGHKPGGVVVHTDYLPATHDAGDGFPAAGRMSVGLELFPEAVRRLNLDGVAATVHATERRVDDWNRADVDVTESAADGTDTEYVCLGEVTAVQSLGDD